VATVASGVEGAGQPHVAAATVPILKTKPREGDDMALFTSHKRQMVSADKALRGRDEAMLITAPHLVLGTEITPPFPEGLERAVLGMGCFWGAERMFWKLPGVYTTAVGYAGGITPNPTYHEVCRGRTGHAEVVLVVYDPSAVTYEKLLGVFFEGHDPTQGMRQGNDVGTQYRSAIYTTSDEQRATAEKVAAGFQGALAQASYGTITTEIAPVAEFYYAEPYHQQYLEANPRGYCGLGGTGVSCAVGLPDASADAG
jgi:peptide-methionine (S)-S-oxide reductase